MMKFTLGNMFIYGIPRGVAYRVEHARWSRYKGDLAFKVDFRYKVDAEGGGIFKVALENGYNVDVLLVNRIFSIDEKRMMAYNKLAKVAHFLFIDELGVFWKILDEIDEEENIELYNDKETKVRKGRGFIGTSIITESDFYSTPFRLFLPSIFRKFCSNNEDVVHSLEGEEHPLYIVVEELKKTNPEIAKEYEPYVNNDIAMKNAKALDAMLRHHDF